MIFPTEKVEILRMIIINCGSMPKLMIIYGTGSHNTELMAVAIEEGIETVQDLCVKRMPGDEELPLCRRVGSLLACKIKK